MRDLARIAPLLELIEAIWRRYPDMRLCQLIGNALPNGDPYFVEDDVLAVELHRLYDSLGSNDA
jgi:uncharacterized protein YihD (DUF1040 family)